MSAIPLTNWRAAPKMLSIEPEHLDIWRLELDQAPCQPDDLDAAETARLNNFKFDHAYQQYCRARTALRIILGRYLNCDAVEVPLTVNSGGKPGIDHASPGLYFNLSHAGNTVLLAVRSGHEVGIDVENHRDLPNAKHLAQRIFRDKEITELKNTEWDRALFFRLWTHMEARQKCLGRGVFGEAASENEAESRSLILKANQYAAIAWPTGTEPKTINFYSGYNPSPPY